MRIFISVFYLTTPIRHTLGYSHYHAYFLWPRLFSHAHFFFKLIIFCDFRITGWIRFCTGHHSLGEWAANDSSACRFDGNLSEAARAINPEKLEQNGTHYFPAGLTRLAFIFRRLLLKIPNRVAFTRK